mgnify:CR=1 FL=1
MWSMWHRQEPKGIRIYYKGKDVTNGTVYYEMKKTNNNLKFTDKILGGKYDATKATWSVSAKNEDVDDQGKKKVMSIIFLSRVLP